MDVGIDFVDSTSMWTVYSANCDVIIKEFKTEEEAYEFVKVSGYNLKRIDKYEEK